MVGTGSLGKEHARIYAELAASGQVAFSGVYDLAPDAARAVAGRHRVEAFASLAAVAAASDAVSVVTPTTTHYAVARELLDQGKHVLVEKPITDRSATAAELVRLAAERGCVLQVGHVERFNPVFEYLQTVATAPRFIEVHRLSPYPARSTDVGVVLDLMIHDLDVVLSFVQAPVTRVEAVGIPVLSATEDIANARLRFANGCVANLTASRVSAERLRKIRVFSGGATPSYVSLDYRAQTGYLYRLAQAGEAMSPMWKKLFAAKDSAIVSEFAGKRIVREPVPLTREEPLKLELTSFVKCVQDRQAPRVSGEAAQRALELAFAIAGQIAAADPAAGVTS